MAFSFSLRMRTSSVILIVDAFPPRSADPLKHLALRRDGGAVHWNAQLARNRSRGSCRRLVMPDWSWGLALLGQCSLSPGCGNWNEQPPTEGDF